MRGSRFAAIGVRWIVAVELALAGSGAALVPVGAEFQVNSYTPNHQFLSAIALDADGDFVVTWQSLQHVPANTDIFAQRYDSTGVAQGVEFQVNSFTPFAQYVPAVDLSPSGDFVVVWTTLLPGEGGYAIFARRFSSTGVAQGVEFQVNTFTPNYTLYSAVALDSSGDFVVVWEASPDLPEDGQDGSGSGIFGQRFNASGAAIGAEFQVNTYTENDQAYPAVDLSAAGDFVVVWQSLGQDGDERGVFARRFNSSGVALATEFQVSSYTSYNQGYSAVALDPDGNFVVAWQGEVATDNGYAVLAKRFNAAGVAQGDEFKVNVFASGDQGLPSVSLDSTGGFVVTWTSNGQENPFGNGGIFARRYDSSGAAETSEFQVNTFTSTGQLFPAVAAEANGDFAIVWHSFSQDGSPDFGVFAQRFSVATSTPSATATASPTITPTATITPTPTRTSTPTPTNSPTASPSPSSTPTRSATPTVTASVSVTATPTPTPTGTTTGTATLDVDANDDLVTLEDGLLIVRYLFGFTGDELISDAVGQGCDRCTPEQIDLYLDSIAAQLDVDGNTALGALSDGLLILRYLFGFTGDALVGGAVGQGCQRCTAAEVIDHLDPLAD